MRIAASSVPDAGAFLARLLRFDPATLVRLRADRAERLTAWARLPFDVLVCRGLAGRTVGAEDVTVRADRLLDSLPDGPLPTRRDVDWRGALPPAPGPAAEWVPAEVLRRVAGAAADTLRQAAGRGVGERRVRDALLDHVAVTLSSGEPPTDTPVPTRVVTALVRMGFLADEPVRFGVVGPWLSAHATFGAVWYRRDAALRVDAAPTHPHG